MKLTKIERQKKNAERYSLYIDGEFWLGVHESVLIQFGLYKSQDITTSTMQEIIASEYAQSVYLRGVHYLSYGLRTIKEMRDYLFEYVDERAKEEVADLSEQRPDLVVESVVQRLIEQKYLDDLMYSQSYIRTHANLNYKGPTLLKHQLRQKGVTDAVIDEALQEYPPQQQLENAELIANKYIASKTNYPPKKLVEKLREQLRKKGYEQGIIQSVLQTIDVSTQEDQQDELLVKESDKALRRLSRKYNGYLLKQKITETLLRKGFDYDAIKRWQEDNSEVFDN
ncbi:RecX family transcriptional regulator [Aerococcaceae bacterium zg-ZJ1578]|uniref:RecX family transcriptional regulator n=1 Tax=Aerococcaceae bacterium zg-252 TaxID=2796928 RepID=UPI001A1FAACF|nr:RecX family transcriptional regulator [Aerococcaceae bacterium zg-1578]